MIWLCAAAEIFFAAALSPSAGAAKSESVRFQTVDHWVIVGIYHPGKKRAAAVLIHGVGSSKEEWSPFAPRLWALGLGTLAIDLRGQGESARGPLGRDEWRSFKDSDWIASENDLKAAVHFLIRHKIPKSRIGLIGASIGANLALAVAGELKIPWVAALSPGENYRGVGLTLPQGSRVCVAASPLDPYAFQTALSLISAPGVVFLQASSGHGVQMFPDEEFSKRLLAWIARNIPRR